jgi:hypothetical protein
MDPDPLHWRTQNLCFFWMRVRKATDNIALFFLDEGQKGDRQYRLILLEYGTGTYSTKSKTTLLDKQTVSNQMSMPRFPPGVEIIRQSSEGKLPRICNFFLYVFFKTYRIRNAVLLIRIGSDPCHFAGSGTVPYQLQGN